MKKLLSLITILTLVFVMLVCSVAGVSAADKLNINNKIRAEVGDIVKFSLYASDVPQRVEDVQLEVFYDSQNLKVVEDEINYMEGGSPVYNIGIADRVLFNSANGIDGWEMKKRTLLFEVGFEVLKTGETDLTYYIQCMDYLHNSKTVDKYVITCDYSINGKTVKKKDVPIVDPNGMGGIFVNYKNGKGPLNGGDEVVGGNGYQGSSANNENLSPGAQQGNIGSQVNLDTTAETQETTIIKTNSSGVAVTTPSGEDATWSESNDFWRNTAIIALSAAIVLVIIIMVMVTKKKQEENQEK